MEELLIDLFKTGHISIKICGKNEGDNKKIFNFLDQYFFSYSIFSYSLKPRIISINLINSSVFNNDDQYYIYILEEYEDRIKELEITPVIFTPEQILKLINE